MCMINYEKYVFNTYCEDVFIFINFLHKNNKFIGKTAIRKFFQYPFFSFTDWPFPSVIFCLAICTENNHAQTKAYAADQPQ
mmetsp:Transcript_4462/g.7833  ORF Transcript_4462/g.7833 Transcript_4462/m.7833 type:complete len:81 (+) Transcript_4462:160-402(+)